MISTHELAMQKMLLQEQKYKNDLAEIELKIAEMALRPHNMVPINVQRDGSRWVCVYACHPDPMRCVFAHGDSPAQACLNFDSVWDGGIILQEPEEEEEF